MDNELHNNRAGVLARAAELALENLELGECHIKDNWPHCARQATRRSYSKADRLELFLDEGFTCQYSGQRLLFTPLLEVLSVLWPDTFPREKNYKSTVTHDAYWTHTASLDHKVPVTIEGHDSRDNWVTTSMARNMVRSRFPLEGLGWTSDAGLPEPGWDGGVGLFVKLMDKYKDRICAHPRKKHLRHWSGVVTRVLNERAATSR